MAEQDIIQNMISQLGQSQADRLPPELGRYFVNVDERSTEELLKQAAELAQMLRFYESDAKNEAVVEAGTWGRFFPADIASIADREDGDGPPHLALLTSFLKLYRYPQRALNALTGRHLDFQFKQILRFEPRPAQADHAHLLLELKKGTAPVVVPRDTMFSAGKDSSGVELIYQPVRDVVVNHGRVVELKSVFRDATGVRFAPVADSVDGLGPPLDNIRGRWSAFGNLSGRVKLQLAQIGFALASPVLRLQEGSREIELLLDVTARDGKLPPAGEFASTFEAFLTGPKELLGPFALDAKFENSKLKLTIKVLASEPAIVDYSAQIHGRVFSTSFPVIQIVLKTKESKLVYSELENISITRAQIAVRVDGLTPQTLENDFGTLNPKKAFQPFGPQPTSGARFLIGSDEALSKRLTRLSAKIRWQGAPKVLNEWYSGYHLTDEKGATVGTVTAARLNQDVIAKVAFQDRDSSREPFEIVLLKNSNNGQSELDLIGTTSSSTFVSQSTPSKFQSARSIQYALQFSGSLYGLERSRRYALAQPVQTQAVQSLVEPIPPAVRAGFIAIELQNDFFHSAFREVALKNALKTPPVHVNEPYTPTVQNLSLSYTAYSDEVNLAGKDEASFTKPDVEFYHIGCFGPMREHAYLRQSAKFLAPADRDSVPLLPQYPHEGEFLIGMAGVSAGDSLSVLMQVVEGSADPDATPANMSWWVLGDNYWKPLTSKELVLDTSNSLRTSGILALTLPSETTTRHSLMPSGMVWLRATLPRSGTTVVNSQAVCQLIQVANNAVEVQFSDHGNDQAHLASALEAGRISKLKTPLAAIKTVTQPFASFGGRMPETDTMLIRRGAERLRHRNRCITPWDYERLLLEAFPDVHKVKCIPHATGTSWTAPGHVLLVVIPDLQNRNAVDRFHPKVDSNKLVLMTEYVQQHCGMFAQPRPGQPPKVRVQNPKYESIQLDFQVRFQAGIPFNQYSQILNEAVISILSPWTNDTSQSIEFGGQIFRSALLDVVEELPYVDFVTEFKMLASIQGQRVDLSEIKATRPDVVLVSDQNHIIREYQDE